MDNHYKPILKEIDEKGTVTMTIEEQLLFGWIKRKSKFKRSGIIKSGSISFLWINTDTGVPATQDFALHLDDWSAKMESVETKKYLF